MDGEDIRELSDVHKESLADFLPRLQLTADTEQSMAINRIKGGAIIIAGSGMCTGGRIRHHFKQRIWDDRNTVIFAGFQARGTLGRLLVDGMQTVKLFGEEYAVKARIETLGCFSAHAGQSELLAWAANFEESARLVLVHGRTPRTPSHRCFGSDTNDGQRYPPKVTVLHSEAFLMLAARTAASPDYAAVVKGSA